MRSSFNAKTQSREGAKNLKNESDPCVFAPLRLFVKKAADGLAGSSAKASEKGCLSRLSFTEIAQARHTKASTSEEMVIAPPLDSEGSCDTVGPFTLMPFASSLQCGEKPDEMERPNLIVSF